MIQKNKIKDLVVFTDENNSKYLNVLNDFLSYDINIQKNIDKNIELYLHVTKKALSLQR